MNKDKENENNQNNIIFPLTVIKTLKDVYNIEQSEALSEIDFATTIIDKITNKRTFKTIYYKVEDSEDDFEIYITNNSYFIDYLGEETEFPFIKSYDFDNETVDVYGNINKIVI